jgi:hypothetical protein
VKFDQVIIPPEKVVCPVLMLFRASKDFVFPKMIVKLRFSLMSFSGNY